MEKDPLYCRSKKKKRAYKAESYDDRHMILANKNREIDLIHLKTNK